MKNHISNYIDKLNVNKSILMETIEKYSKLFPVQITVGNFDCVSYLEVDSFGNLYLIYSNYNENPFISEDKSKEITICSIDNKIHIFGKLKGDIFSQSIDNKLNYDFSLDIWEKYLEWFLSDSYSLPKEQY